MPQFEITIVCKGKPIPEYFFENVEATDKEQARQWAIRQPLPHQKIKKIDIKEIK